MVIEGPEYWVGVVVVMMPNGWLGHHGFHVQHLGNEGGKSRWRRGEGGREGGKGREGGGVKRKRVIW